MNFSNGVIVGGIASAVLFVIIDSMVSAHSESIKAKRLKEKEKEIKQQVKESKRRTKRSARDFAAGQRERTLEIQHEQSLQLIELKHAVDELQFGIARIQKKLTPPSVDEFGYEHYPEEDHQSYTGDNPEENAKAA